MATEMLAVVLAIASVAVDETDDTIAKPATISTASISDKDYPKSAIEAGEEGSTIMRLLVSTQGKVTECQIAQTSGSTALDQQSCLIWTTRFRYKPARDAAGAKVPQWLEESITWTVATPCSGFPKKGMGICVTAPRR